MNDHQNRVKALFDRALELESTADRSAYLAEACGPDAELRDKVQALLDAYFDAESFLDSPPPKPPPAGMRSRPASTPNPNVIGL